MRTILKIILWFLLPALFVLYLFTEYNRYEIEEDDKTEIINEKQSEIVRYADSNDKQVKLIYKNTEIIVQKKANTRSLEKRINELNYTILYQNIGIDSLKIIQHELLTLLDSLKGLYYREVIEGFKPNTLECDRAIRALEQKNKWLKKIITSRTNDSVTAQIMEHFPLTEKNQQSNYCADVRKLRLKIYYSNCLPIGKMLFVIIKKPDGTYIAGSNVSTSINYKGKSIKPSAVIENIKEGENDHTLVNITPTLGVFYPVDIVDEKGNSVLVHRYNLFWRK